jgi:hypothetical protein
VVLTHDEPETLPWRDHLRNARQLVAHVEAMGPLCIHADDIQNGADALTCPVLRQAVVDAIITNPPYTWAILKGMLDLFPSLAPTWLLLEARFAFVGQSRPYMRICSDVVPIGQIRWFEGTKHKSRDHYAWYRFDAAHQGITTFHPLQPRTRTTAPDAKAA